MLRTAFLAFILYPFFFHYFGIILQYFLMHREGLGMGHMGEDGIGAHISTHSRRGG